MGRHSVLNTLFVCALVCSQSLRAQGCEVLLSSANLESDLDQVLGPWRALARERHVSIVPDEPECYVQIRIVVNVPLGGDCALEACSVATFQGHKIGLQAFDVRGCDALVALFPVSRHVPEALADATEQIRANCGSEAFEISSVQPVLLQREARIRVKLRSAGSEKENRP